MQGAAERKRQGFRASAVHVTAPPPPSVPQPSVPTCFPGAGREQPRGRARGRLRPQNPRGGAPGRAGAPSGQSWRSGGAGTGVRGRGGSAGLGPPGCARPLQGRLGDLPPELGARHQRDGGPRVRGPRPARLCCWADAGARRAGEGTPSPGPAGSRSGGEKRLAEL